MAILKIARMGHPILRKKASRVDDSRAPEIIQLIEDMIETMKDAGGVGLAAPQVHVGVRIVIFHVPKGRDDSAQTQELTVLINPEIAPLDDEKVTAMEGCLSIPGMAGPVPRFRRIRYKALDRNGVAFEKEAEGFHARVVQHECDHLDGILYPQRIEDLSNFGFVEELQKS